MQTVISLRDDETVAQEGRVVESLGMRFLNFPIAAGSNPSEDVVNGAVRALTDQSLFPIYIHCQRGKARTSLIVGLYRVFVQHWPRDRAYEEMKAFGFNGWHFALKRYWDTHTR